MVKCSCKAEELKTKKYYKITNLNNRNRPGSIAALISSAEKLDLVLPTVRNGIGPKVIAYNSYL